MIDFIRGLRGILNEQSRTRATERLGVIESRNPNGTYQLRDIHSNSVVTVSRRTAQESWALRTRVLYGAPDASGRVKGASPVILGRAPRDFRGLAGSATAFSTEGLYSLLITRVSPSPVRLTRGGAAVVVAISGRNLVGPVTYSDANVTNDAAQVITATLVTLTIKALAGAGTGPRDITVGGLTIPAVIEIL